MAKHKLYFEENYLFVIRLADNIRVFHYPAHNSIAYIREGMCYVEHMFNSNTHIRFVEEISELIDGNDVAWGQVNLHNTLIARTGLTISSTFEYNGVVDDYTDLTAIAAPVSDDLYYVRNTIFTGVWPLRTERLAGTWRYNGTAWTRETVPSKVITEDENGAQVHDSSLPYYEGNLIWYNSKLQRCKADIAPKAYDANDWEDAGGASTGGSDFWEATSTDTTTAYIYKGGLNGTAWQINRYDRANGMARTAATVSNNIGTTTLTAAWSGRLTLNYN